MSSLVLLAASVFGCDYAAVPIVQRVVVRPVVQQVRVVQQVKAVPVVQRVKVQRVVNYGYPSLSVTAPVVRLRNGPFLRLQIGR